MASFEEDDGLRDLLEATTGPKVEGDEEGEVRALLRRLDERSQVQLRILRSLERQAVVSPRDAMRRNPNVSRVRSMQSVLCSTVGPDDEVFAATGGRRRDSDDLDLDTPISGRPQTTGSSTRGGGGNGRRRNSCSDAQSASHDLRSFSESGLMPNPSPGRIGANGGSECKTAVPPPLHQPAGGNSDDGRHPPSSRHVDPSCCDDRHTTADDLYLNDESSAAAAATTSSHNSNGSPPAKEHDTPIRLNSSPFPKPLDVEHKVLAERLAAAEVTIDALTADKETLWDQLEHVEESKQTVEREAATLKRRVKELNEALEKAEATAARHQQQLQLAALQQRTAAAAAAAAAAHPSQQGFSSAGSGVHHPVEGPEVDGISLPGLSRSASAAGGDLVLGGGTPTTTDCRTSPLPSGVLGGAATTHGEACLFGFRLRHPDVAAELQAARTARHSRSRAATTTTTTAAGPPSASAKFSRQPSTATNTSVASPTHKSVTASNRSRRAAAPSQHAAAAAAAPAASSAPFARTGMDTESGAWN